MLMLIALINELPLERRWIVGGGGDIAAAALFVPVVVCST